VYVKSVPSVRIPPCPLKIPHVNQLAGFFLYILNSFLHIFIAPHREKNGCAVVKNNPAAHGEEPPEVGE
jgi:hypothetical protein